MADQAALTMEAHKLVTCAELGLRDVQDEGVGSHTEVTGALSQGETGEARQSHDTGVLGAPCPQPQPLDPSAQSWVAKNS